MRSRNKNLAMPRLLVYLCAAVILGGCKAGQGDVCSQDSDCRDALKCAPDKTCQTGAAIAGQKDELEERRAEQNDPAMNLALKKAVTGTWVCQNPSSKHPNSKTFSPDGTFEMFAKMTLRQNSKWSTETKGKWWINYVKLCLRLDSNKTLALNESAKKLEKMVGGFPQPFKTGVAFCLGIPHHDKNSLLIESPMKGVDSEICRRPRKGESR